jgi:hypothetical protein
MVREIHLANIYFTDGVGSKVRPILLLKANSFKDILYLPLTSNISTKGVKIDSNDLDDGFLPKTSIVVYEKPGVIDPSLLVKKIGTLQANTYQQIITDLIQFLQK